MVRFASIFLLFWLGSSGLSWACFCYKTGAHPCELAKHNEFMLSGTGVDLDNLSPSEFKEREVVFSGTVIYIENPAPDEDASRSADGTGLSRYRFAVSENFSGVPGNEVDVYSGRGGADCSYHFKPNEAYLVYAFQDNFGRLQVSMCSETRPLDQAAALLPQLRAARDSRPVASLFGTLHKWSSAPGLSGAKDRPLADAPVRLISQDGNILTTRTNGSGAYAFYSLASGPYTISADLPKHWAMNDRLSHGSPKPVYISARACEELDADVLPPGRNYKTKGQQIATPDIRLREGVKTRQLIVRLAWEGTPPENMPLFVLAESNKRDMPVTQRLEPGVFFVTMREDARYTIHGESYCRPFAPVKTKDITVNGADGSSQELQLTLAKSLCATN